MFLKFRRIESIFFLFHIFIDRSNCCYMFTSSSGVLSSLDGDENYNGCTWLISVEKNSTIWLTFTEFYVDGSYFSMKVRLITLLFLWINIGNNTTIIRFMMGLTQPVLCCWIVTDINHQNLYDHEVTSFLFKCLQNTIDPRTMGNNSRHIILLYVWRNTVLNLKKLKLSEFIHSF